MIKSSEINNFQNGFLESRRGLTPFNPAPPEARLNRDRQGVPMGLRPTHGDEDADGGTGFPACVGLKCNTGRNACATVFNGAVGGLHLCRNARGQLLDDLRHKDLGVAE